MSIKKIGFTLFISIVSIFNLISQSTGNYEQVKALNNYVNFSNECTHGLLLVHRLLDKFNKNINKYVDLPDQQINFYSNKDLPQDIFEDPEKMFYDISPNAWLIKIDGSKGKLPAALESSLGKSTTNMKRIITSINNIRFELDDQIKVLDLTKRENLSLVYDKLEEGVKLYKEYYKFQQELEKDIAIHYKTLKFSNNEIQFPKVVNALQRTYDTNRAALNALYFKDDDNFGELIKKEQLALASLDSIRLTDYNSTRLINSKVQMWWANILKQAKNSILEQKSFAESENIPEEFKLYDKYYYYYNFPIIDKFNRYGMGIVFEMNRIMDYLDIPVLKKFEMPHYFKVIYPNIILKDRYITSSNPNIKSFPISMKNRSVSFKGKKIKFDSLNVEFYVIDNKIIDNDRMSLSYNGDWIIQNEKLSEKPIRFRLQLNSQGKNYLLLYTNDMGRNPPTTIGISYYYKNKKEVITMTSNEGENELIELVYDTN